jgi:glycosyltransferase involved in cell wall biosynthesis
MKHGRRILFLTVDGLLQGLGYSQVVRVVEGLAKRGYQYDIGSLERPNDLERNEARSALEARLASVGVRWFFEPYDTSGSARTAASNLGRLVQLVAERTATNDYGLLHARSYLAAMPAMMALATRRVPYLFDVRGYWIDERIEEGRWFTNPVAEKVARAAEQAQFRAAAGVVTLTELQADDVRNGAFGPRRGRPVVAIPTCADYDEFQMCRGEAYRTVPPDVLSKLEGRLVLGFVGSLNRSYLSDEAARLARLVLHRRDDAFVLALGTQRTEYANLFARHGIPPDRFIVQPVDHREMPEWMSLIRWGILLLDSPRAKRGSMPTKLAEFFAAGVRPIQHGCNAEVSEWVQRAGSGYVLPDLTEAELVRAADFVCASRGDEDELRRRARGRTEGHFSLAAGVARYEDVLARAAPAIAR